ncbi:MAG TPA: autotransporter-associated beta strand repeat-containing protein, partial [Gemmataceae bacterium]|nr:autotransporter-associated beta strand repeat-containing protein [Gemmataceae bacterium]
MKNPRIRLNLEELETRLAPAISWIGPSGGAWSNNANWSQPLVAGADLVFPAISAAKTSVDDLAGFSVNSITFSPGSTAGYTLTTSAGVTLTLGGASTIITDMSGFNGTNGAFQGDVISMQIALNGGAGTQAVDISSSTLTFSGGSLSGTSQMTVQGGGTLVMNQANTFGAGEAPHVSQVTISGNTLVQMTNSNAFGDAANPVTVNLGSEIQVSGGITGPYNVKLSGFGLGSNSGDTSPLQSMTGSNNAWTGSITFDTSGTAGSMYFTVGSNNSSGGGSRFTIYGVISDSGSGSNLSKWGQGDLVLVNANQYGGTTTLKAGNIIVQDPQAFGPSSSQQVFIPTGSLQLNYMGASITGVTNTVNPTITTSAAHGFVVGQQITIANVVGATGVNGTFTITSVPTPTTFTIALASAPGAYLYGGSANPPYVGPSPYILMNTAPAIITGASWSAGVATISASNTFTTGQTVTISGMTPAGYNGTYTILSANGSSFTYALAANPGTATAFGNATVAQTDKNPYVGFLMNYPLILSGFTLNNVFGANAWSGTVSMTSGSFFNVANTPVFTTVNTQLDITGVISGNSASLTKQGAGNLILEPTDILSPASPTLASTYRIVTLNDGSSVLAQAGTGTSNLYTGGASIQGGVVTLEDSQGLGPITSTATTTVFSGSSLHLVANVGHVDSVSGQDKSLEIYAPLQLLGGSGPSGEGALDSISGINIYKQNPNYTQAGLPRDMITVNQGTAIGVLPEPVESDSNAYLTDDYSLTLEGLLGNSNGGFSAANWISKVGGGNLILPTANTNFYGSWDIKQGWVTVRNEWSLGGLQGGKAPNKAQGAYFNTTVESGAALMIVPLVSNSSMTLATNLILQGEGITHAFSKINDMGAVENLSGVTTLTGHITLEGQVGLGVESIFPGIVSDLTTTNEITQALPPGSTLVNKPSIPSTINIANTLAKAGVSQYAQVVDTGSTSFDGTINYTNFAGDQIEIYYGPRGTPGSRLLFSGTFGTPGAPASGSFAFNNFAAPGPGDSTEIEIVINKGNSSAGSSTWSYNGSINVNPVYFTGGITKVGSQRLVLEGNGIYQGGVDIRQGVVQINNDTALGQPQSAGDGLTFGTNVEAGAALVIGPTIANQTGGISRGLSVWGNHLTLHGTGNSTFGYAPLTVLSDDNLWTGPVTLRSTLSLTFQGTLANSVLPDDPVSIDFSGLLGTNATIDVATTTVASSTVSGVETLTFGGTITGGTFTMTIYDGVKLTGTTVANSNVISGLASTTQLSVGMMVSGAGIPAGSRIIAKTANSITLDHTASAGATITVYFSFTTAPIAYSVDPYTLINNIQNALALDPNVTNFQNNVLLSFVSPTIDVAPNARMNIMGAIDDGNSGSVAPDPSSDLIVSGGGEVTFNGANTNTYRGTTYIQQGSLTLSNTLNTQPLGSSPLNAGSQSLILTNAVAGQTYFKLSFAGQTTAPILYTGTSADALAIQAALAGLSTINAGNVSVIQGNAGIFLVRFNNGLANTSTVLVAAIDTTHPLGIVAGTTIVAGIEGGTEVANNAQIQLEGGIHVNNEPLVLQGQGSNLEPTVQTFTVGGDTTGSYQLNFNGASTPISPNPGSINYDSTAAEIQAALQNLPTVGGAGGQVRVIQTDVSPGLSDQQTITFNNSWSGGTFQLQFGPTPSDPNVYVTPAISYDASSYFNTAANISQALKSLGNIGGAFGQADVSGSFLAGGETFKITFTGALA